MKTRNLALSIVVLALAAIMAFGIAYLSSDTVAFADPVPETISDVKLVDLADGETGYTSDRRLRLYAQEYGIADIYATAVLSETDLLTLTLQHSPDGADAWVSTTNVLTFTAATAPESSHFRVPIYGQAIGVYMNISGTIRYTPTIYVVLKNNAGD